LVEVAALAMSLCAGIDCRGEAERSQLVDDVRHVVVEVTTDDDRSVRVLSDNVPDNISDSHGPLLQVLLFSRLEVTIENLDVMVAELQLSPAEIRAKCLHQLESSVRSRRIPASATSLLHGLIRPEAIEIEWRLQLGLVEADHLRSVVLQEIVDDLLLGLGVEASDIEGDQFELLPVGFHMCEVTTDMLLFLVGGSVSPIFSVASSTPTICTAFLLGLHFLRCLTRVETTGSSIPTLAIFFLLL